MEVTTCKTRGGKSWDGDAEDAADRLKVSEICRLMVSVNSLGPDSPVSQILSDLSAGSVLVLNCWSSPWKLWWIFYYLMTFFFLDQMINLKDLDSVTKIYMNRNTHTASNMMIRTEKQILRAEPVFMFWCRYRYVDNSTKTQRFFAAIPQMWLTNTTTCNDGSIFSFQ